MSFRRQAKYRHVVGSKPKPEQCFKEVNLAAPSRSAHNLMAASPAYLAFATGTGNAVGCVPVAKPGRFNNKVGTVSSGSSAVWSLAWNPFHDRTIAVGNEAGGLVVSKLTEGFSHSKSDSEVIANLNAHSSKTAALAWHRSAKNILASGGGDKTIAIWDLKKAAQYTKLSGSGAEITDLSWNWEGSLLASGAKDKTVRVWDPRAGKNVAQGTGDAIDGNAAVRVIWMARSHDLLLTTGTSKATRQRHLAVWDPRKLSAPLRKEGLDSNTGQLCPYYDEDSELLWLVGKGDSNIRVFEMVKSSPYWFEADTYTSAAATKAFCFLPKLGVDVMDVEITRCYKHTSDGILTIPFNVPSRSKYDFRDDLFPHTASSHSAMSASDWIGGANKAPKTTSLRPENDGGYEFGVSDAKPSSSSKLSAPSSSSKSRSSSTGKSGSHRKGGMKKSGSSRKKSAKKGGISFGAATVIEDPPPEVDDGKVVEVAAKDLKVDTTNPMKYITGVHMGKGSDYNHLKVDTSPNPEVNLIQANSAWFAVPWKVSGGSALAIHPLSQTGRVAPSGLITGHSSTLCGWKFDPFNENRIASAADDGSLRVWNIPPAGLKDHINEPAADLIGHERRVTALEWHSTASDILSSGGADDTLRIWDVSRSKEVLNVSGHKGDVESISWNFNGALCATASKDRKIRIVDPRKGGIVAEAAAHTGSKPWNVLWFGRHDVIVSIGHSKSSNREIMIWDAKNLSKPVKTELMDTSSSVQLPILDHDTGTLVLQGKGDSAMRLYEVVPQAPWLFGLNDYMTPLPGQGVAAIPKLDMEVTKCEVMRLLKLTRDKVEPGTFQVPRKNKHYFQDDLFPPTRIMEPTMDAATWLKGSNKEPKFRSMQPRGMKKQSEAPKPKPVMKKKFDEERGPNITRDDVWNRFESKVFAHKTDDPLPQDLVEGVDDDEWD